MHTVIKKTLDWDFDANTLSSVADVPREDIESIRDATIITSIEVEDDFISIATSDADNPDQENVVSFVPGDLVEISNPLNGETVEVLNDGNNLLLSNFFSVCGDCAQSHDDTDSERGSGLWHNRGQDLDVHAGGGDGEDGGAARQPALSGGL